MLKDFILKLRTSVVGDFSFKNTQKKLYFKYISKRRVVFKISLAKNWFHIKDLAEILLRIFFFKSLIIKRHLK